MQSIKQKSQSGFALLETLLALAILSLVLVFVAAWIQRADRRHTAQVIAQEFNMILGASTSYHHDTGQWPSEMKDLYQNNYLPHPNSYNPSDPSQRPPLVHFSPRNGYQVTPPSGQSNPNFQVSLCVPSQIWASAITPLLPYAKQDPLIGGGGQPPPAISCPDSQFSMEVIAEIGASALGAPIAMQMVHPGGRTNDDKVPKPDCPSGVASRPKIYVSIESMDLGGDISSFVNVYPVDDQTEPKKWWVAQIQYLTTQSPGTNINFHTSDPDKQGGIDPGPGPLTNNHITDEQANNTHIIAFTSCGAP
jgi:prepilin-type N-terminal cleavage/methylation domain-containing protein